MDLLIWSAELEQENSLSIVLLVIIFSSVCIQSFGLERDYTGSSLVIWSTSVSLLSKVIGLAYIQL